MNEKRTFSSLKEFYPYYLSEHQNTVNRVLHFVGIVAALIVLVNSLASAQWLQLLWVPIFGYGFAWTGHFFFEKNRPTTFQYPLYSLLSDLRLTSDILIGKQRFKVQKTEEQSDD